MYSESLECITYLETYKSLNNIKTLSIKEESLLLKEAGYNYKLIENTISLLHQKSNHTPKLNKFIEKNSKNYQSFELKENVNNLSSYIDKTVIPESAKKVVESNINLVFIMAMSDILKKEIESRISTIVSTAKLIPALYILGLSSFLNFKKSSNEKENTDEENTETTEENKLNQKEEKDTIKPEVKKPLPIENQKENYSRFSYKEQEEQTNLEDLDKLPENFIKMEEIWKNVENKYVEFLKVVNSSFDEFTALMPELKSVSSVKKGTTELNSKLANGINKFASLINSVNNIIKK